MRQVLRRKLISLCRVGDTNKEPYMSDIYLPTYMVLFIILFHESGRPSNRSGLFPKPFGPVLN